MIVSRLETEDDDVKGDVNDEKAKVISTRHVLGAFSWSPGPIRVRLRDWSIPGYRRLRPSVARALVQPPRQVANHSSQPHPLCSFVDRHLKGPIAPYRSSGDHTSRHYISMSADQDHAYIKTQAQGDAKANIRG